MIGLKQGFHEVDVLNASVLIVEDENVSRRALATLLARLGYRPTAVASAEEALEMVDAGHQSPEIALIDLDLPGMGGAELISRLNVLDKRIVPIVISAAENEKIFTVLESRGIPFLRKPLNFDHLLTLMSEAKTLH
ncbi:MAG TPA: response regulator [Tepidisphaeraceae bacterium]|jgi:CheY-like chemotaxis protein|nr:response regulator [Tepidisphaeraceae bacterium]